MKANKHFLRAVLTISLCPICARAADKPIKIQVDAMFEPTAAVGIVLTKNGISERPASSFKRKDRGIEVTLNVAESELTEDATITAMVSGAAGERAYGEMLPLISYTPAESLVTCPDKPAKESLDAGSLEQLIDLRTRRRDIAKKQLAEVLSSDGLIDKLSNVEQLFGLSAPRPFSAELDPLELLERLSRINAAVESYRIGRQKLVATQTTASPTEASAPDDTH